MVSEIRGLPLENGRPILCVLLLGRRLAFLSVFNTEADFMSNDFTSVDEESRSYLLFYSY